MKKILIYGDSNVWGDNFLTGVRILDEKQWPNILQKSLGNDYIIYQEGLPGRLAGEEEKEKKFKNGKTTFLSTFRTKAPVDIIIIALGTNDLQIKYQKSSRKIIKDLLWYKETIEKEYEDDENKEKYFKDKKMPIIMYILPINFDYKEKATRVFDNESHKKRLKIVESFIASDLNYLALSDLPLFEDGIHLNDKGHEKMAREVEKYIKLIKE